MWRLVGKPKTQRATKALSKQFAEMEAAPNDRALSERRLQVYQRMLQDEAFRPCTWALVFCKETGGTYRVNGKHTSTMLSGLDEIPEFYVTIEEYECDTLEDVARLYGTFDSRTQSRTSQDINRAFAATIKEFAEIPGKIINVAVTGLSLNKWMESYGSIPAPERAELMLEHPDFILWLFGICEGQKATSKHILRGGVVAAMFACWTKCQRDASQFWLAVRDETGSSPDLPDRKLARFLLTVNVNNGKGAASLRHATQREFFVRSLHAWNAWRRKEKTDLKYYQTGKLPAAV